MAQRRRGLEGYTEVKDRVTAFRAKYPVSDGWGIHTELVYIEDPYVRMMAWITNPEGVTVATGHAEEVRGVGMVNKTSAVENCETSAIGRALFAAGFGGDGAYASADEIRIARAKESDGRTAPTPEETVRKLVAALPDGDTRITWEDWLTRPHGTEAYVAAFAKLKGGA